MLKNHRSRPGAESTAEARALIASIKDYAIFQLDPDGTVLSWNEGARLAKGYEEAEIVGRSFTAFYNKEDVIAGKPKRLLEIAAREGRVEDRGWRIRKDGTPFWADVVITALYDEDHNIRGFVKVTRDLTEQKAAEEALRSSEHRLRLLIDGVRDHAIFMIDQQGNISTWNAGAERVKGYKPSEVIGKNISMFYTPEDRAAGRPKELLGKALREGRSTDLGWRIRKDGTRFWADVSISRVDDEDGNVQGFVKITRDLTERRLAEETTRDLVREQAARTAAELGEARLRESEGRYRDLSERLEVILQGVTDGIIVQDVSGRVVYANEAAARITGFPTLHALLESAAGDFASRFELFDEDGAPMPLARLAGRSVLNNEQPSPAVMRLHDRNTDADAWLLVKSTPIRDRVGAPRLAITVWHDVTWQRHQQRADRFLARASTELSKSLHAPETAEMLAQLTVPELADRCEIDLQGEEAPSSWTLQRTAHGDRSPVHHQSADATSPAALEVLATGRAQHLPDLDPQKLATLARDDGHLRRLEALNIRSAIVVPIATSERRFGALTVFSAERKHRFDRDDLALFEELGRRSGIALDKALAYELESRARADAQTAQSALQEANRRKDDFLAVLAHELRNPLAPIRNAVELIRRDPESPALITRASSVIDRQVEHMARMVDDLLDDSRITRGKVVLREMQLDLVAVVRGTIEDHRALFEANDLELVSDLPNDPIPTVGDETRLAQVVGSLLTNAAKFSDLGGRVQVTLQNKDGRAFLSVKDSGVGVPPELLGQMFEPFAQDQQTLARTRGGLGLGLALVKGFVELHGGKVRAVSAGRGKGTEVTIELPIRGAPKPEEPKMITAKPRPKRVLIIEDNADAAETLGMFLEMLEHEVKIAGDGETGLELAANFNPDLILCDVGLPGQLDGYGVAQELRKNSSLSGTYLVALTGYGKDEDRSKALEAGFDLHLTKPVSPKVIEGLLSQLDQER